MRRAPDTPQPHPQQRQQQQGNNNRQPHSQDQGNGHSKRKTNISYHVENLENKTDRLATALSNLTHGLCSFATLATDRMDSISNQLADQHKAILNTEIQRFSFETHISHLTTIWAEALREAQCLFTDHAAFDEFLLAAQALLQDKLSLYLIPFSDIKTIILNINAKLNRKQAHLQVMELNSKDMYGHLPFIWTYNNHFLFITLKFPLVAHESKLSIYKIHYFAVPLNSSTSHATKLISKDLYFAVTINHDYYALPSHDMITDMTANIKFYMPDAMIFLYVISRNHPAYPACIWIIRVKLRTYAIFKFC